MDIRPPKHAIRSAREFLVEIATVTCGIVIALGLEALLASHHNSALRDQAQREFHAEISGNRARLNDLLKGKASDGELIEKLLHYGTDRLAHRPASLPADLSLGRSFSLLANDAWQTALATQAIGQMNFDQVRTLSALQDGQVIFNDLETRAREQWVGLAAFSDPTQLTDADIRMGLQTLRIAYAYQMTVVALAEALIGKADAAEHALGPAGN